MSNGLLGGAFGALFGGGGADSQNAALQQIQNIPLPVLKEYYPELYKQVVSLNPELETAVTLGPSAMEGVSTDPMLRQAQMKALMKLQEVGDAGGRDAQFLADSNRLQSDVNTNLQGNLGAIQQNMALRGMSGGGGELVAKQMQAQNASNRQAQLEMDLNAQAQKRALEAIMNAGQLGGQMQQQDFNQQSQIAQAKDVINKFNTVNSQDVNMRNTGIKNNAKQWNATNTQNTANQNTQLDNDAKKYNLNLPQQNFANRVTKATGVANQFNSIARTEDAERDRNANFLGGLIGAGAMAYSGGGKK